MPDEKERLVAEIEAEVEGNFLSGRTNNYADLICSVLTIGASFLATICAATKVPPLVTATIAALPALCAGLQKVVDFRGRASWYFMKSTSLNVIARNLKYACVSIEDSARQFNDIDIKMEERYRDLTMKEKPTTAISGGKAEG